VRQAAVRERALEERRSLESTARELRYACFEQAADALGATIVVTGHTLDDQAETVMMRLLAGTGTRGLSGVRARRGRYRRPLLDCRRDRLRAWLASRGEPFRTDTSNEDISIPRNLLRRELMPVINRVAPGGLVALARLADLAADDEVVLEKQATEWLPKLVLRRAGGTAINAGALRALPPAIARRVIRAVLAEVAPGARIGAGHLETVRRLATSEKKEGRLDLPGVLVVSRPGGLLVLPASDNRRRPALQFEYPLSVPGTVDIREAGAIVSALAATVAPPEALESASGRVALQASAVELPLTVRNRRPGDRFRPLGAPGRRKVQDLLVDRKVPRQDRDRVPIVVDRSGRVVWVAGIAVAERCRVTAPETGVVILELRNNP
jgi:tRNA(Ile)-lysidine synthase